MKIITPLKGRLALILPFLLLLPAGAAYATSPAITDHTYIGADSALGTITFATEVDEDTDGDENLDIDETDPTYAGWTASIDGDSNFDVGADKDSSGGWSLGDVDYNNSTGLCDEAIASNCSPRTLDEQDIADLANLVGNGSVTSTVGGFLINGDAPAQNEDLDGDQSFDRFAEDLDNDGNQDEFEDLNGNGVLDTGEDTDHNGVWSVGDVDIDNDLGFGYNYTVDGNEADTTFLGTLEGLDTAEDVNNNNTYDYLEDIDSDGIADVNEDVDLDGNFDAGEDSNGNKLWDVGEVDYDNSACANYGIACSGDAWDPATQTGGYVVQEGDDLVGTAKGMSFTEDLNNNGVFDLGEDLDGDGRFDLTYEDQNLDGQWDLVEDQSSDGYWSVGDIDIDNDLGFGYNYTITNDDLADIDTLLTAAINNGSNGSEYLYGDLDASGDWSVGDIDYGQVLGIARDPLSGVWDPLTSDDIANIIDINANAPLFYLIDGLDSEENDNGGDLSLFNEDLNGDEVVYSSSEDLDGDGTLDLIEDQDSDGVWSVGDIDYNNSLGLGVGYVYEDDATRNDGNTYDSTTAGLNLSELAAGDGDSDFDLFSEDVDGDGFFDSISEDFDGDGTQDLAYEDQDGDNVLDLVDETTMTVENQNGDLNALNVIADDLQINGDSVATQDSLDAVEDVVVANASDISDNAADISDNAADISDNASDISSNGSDISDLESDRQAIIDASGFTVAPQIQLGDSDQIVVSEELAPSWVVNGTNYLDDTSTILESVVELDTQVNDVADDLATEVDRATSAEIVLTQDLATEVGRATAAEAVLTQDLATEVGRATAAEAVLAQDLADEVTRATAAEAVLTQDLATEVGRATAAEAVLTQDLATEVGRATAAEAVLTQDLATEVGRATAAEAVLTQDLATEVGRATAAEAVLTQDLADEVTRATAAEAVLTQDLATEVGRATAAEAVLTQDLATEVGRATAAEAVLTQDLATEVGRATAAEAVLTQDLATEVGRATAAEAVLTQDLATEVGRATAAEAVLTQDLATEVGRATAAEAVLTQDLATEVARATAAEAVLTQDLAAEVTRATGAESVLTQNLAAEVTRATGAESVLTQDLAAEVTRATQAELANRQLINNNSSYITANQAHLRRLDSSVDMLRSGVAMSMALAGMPTTSGKGTNFAIGVGGFDGESAVSIGLTHKSRRAAYKLGLTHAGGETGVAAGASWRISK